MNTATNSPAATILAKWTSLTEAWEQGLAASPSPSDFARVYLDHTQLELDPTAWDVIELVASCWSEAADMGADLPEILDDMDMEYNVSRDGE